MNERIRELMVQADYPAPELALRAQKLAELIVRECAEVCNRIYFDNYPDAEDFERSEEGDAIKQHFGVEE